MSKTPNFDAKMEALLSNVELGERTCPISGEKWNFDEREMAWCKKFNCPPSNYSPTTRMKLLGSFRGMFEIFWNKHMETGEPILSYIHPDNPIPVVLDTEWHGMDIGAMPKYQGDLNSDEPFFDQFRILVNKIPMGARREWKNIVNTIGVGMWDVEDSYMVFSTIVSKRAMYTYYCLEGSEDVTQSVYVNTSNNCYGCTQITRCHTCNVALESRDCIKCDFIYDCRNCEYCFGAANLRNKKYIWFGEQLEKAEWEKRRAEVDLGCRSVFDENHKKFIELVESSVSPENFNVNAQNSTGEYLADCLNCNNCFWMRDCKDSDWCQVSMGCDNNAYIIGAWPATNSYMGAMVLKSDRVKYCNTVGDSQNLEYCFNCHYCENCFGCIGLQKKKFHIFNKSYSEDEYWQKVDEIKTKMLERGEYGEFFSQDMSQTGTQFGNSAVFYDMDLEESKRLGGTIYDPDRGAVLAPEKSKEQPLANIKDVPDCVDDVGAEFIGKPFMDTNVNRRWAAIPRELEIYKKNRLPFPREHYSSRLRKLIHMMNAPVYEDIQCGNCQKQIHVAKNRIFKNRKVFCMDCYLKYLETR